MPLVTMSRLLSRLLFLLCTLAATSSFAGEDYVWAPDFPEGASIPLLEAPDHDGNVQTLATLSGTRGLVLLFARSYDWCPFCKAQLLQLIPVVPSIEALGFKVATLTYDPVATLKAVAEDEGIAFTLLHDEGVKHVNAYGILNKDYEPGHYAYGIPQPGILVIGPDGTILKKFAEEDFRERPDFDIVLEALATVVKETTARPR